MDRHSSPVVVASGNHAGAVVFTIGVGVVLLIAIYISLQRAAASARPSDRRASHRSRGEPRRSSARAARDVALASAAMARRDAYQWWVALSADAKRQLVENPDGPIPDDLIEEVTGKGALIVGTWWPDVQEGPDGYHVAQREYVELLKRLQLERTCARAEEAYQAEAAQYLPVPMTPNTKLAKPLDDAGRERLNELMTAAADAY